MTAVDNNFVPRDENYKGIVSDPSKAGFGYDNSVSLQTDDAGHVGAAVLAHALWSRMKSFRSEIILDE